ncbi:hypothetical protein RRG08_057355 [Elysia crispata]|uniref:Uncharacterized protein n=1 Tax=Elysia crispata TaxID=231223 RepID=A0AAE0YJR1_9GAST|nr:hypothetical protein RRG08_057355 [Elysia crispata]
MVAPRKDKNAPSGQPVGMFAPNEMRGNHKRPCPPSPPKGGGDVLPRPGKRRMPAVFPDGGVLALRAKTGFTLRGGVFDGRVSASPSRHREGGTGFAPLKRVFALQNMPD